MLRCPYTNFSLPLAHPVNLSSEDRLIRLSSINGTVGTARLQLLRCFFSLRPTTIRNHLLDSSDDLHPSPNTVYSMSQTMHNRNGITFFNIIKIYAPFPTHLFFPQDLPSSLPFITVPHIFCALLQLPRLSSRCRYPEIPLPTLFPRLGATESTSIASILGIAFGVVAGGFISDKMAQRSTRRNNVIREPEHRLPAFFRPLSLRRSVVFCLVLHSPTNRIDPSCGLFSSISHWHVVLTLLFRILWTDNFPWTGEAMVAVNVVKNLVAFSVSCGVVPWLLKSGWEKMWGTVMGICGAVTLLSIPVDLFSSPAREE